MNETEKINELWTLAEEHGWFNAMPRPKLFHVGQRVRATKFNNFTGEITKIHDNGCDQWLYTVLRDGYKDHMTFAGTHIEPVYTPQLIGQRVKITNSHSFAFKKREQ